MATVQLIHWNEAQARPRVGELRKLGFEVRFDTAPPAALMRSLKDSAPDLIVIDLTRLPSQGREVGIILRQRSATRNVPLVFAGGDPEKVRRVRELLPDAGYSGWSDIGEVIEKTLVKPPERPVVPSTFAAYAGRSLVEKLGIRKGASVGLIDPPDSFEKDLGELPEGVSLVRSVGNPVDLAIWFARSRRELEAGMNQALRLASEGPVWIAWLKQASGQKTDLTQQAVRKAGLAAGLVDYKICSIDSLWSGLLFRRKK